MRKDCFSSLQFNPPVSSSESGAAVAGTDLYRERRKCNVASVLDTIFSSAPLLQKSLELTAGWIPDLKFKNSKLDDN